MHDCKPKNDCSSPSLAYYFFNFVFSCNLKWPEPDRGAYKMLGEEHKVFEMFGEEHKMYKMFGEEHKMYKMSGESIKCIRCLETVT